MVLVHRGGCQFCGQAARPKHRGRFHHVIRSQTKVARERRRHAVALTSTNAAHLGAKRPRDLHRRPHRIAVGLEAFKLEGDPVLVEVPVIDPQHIVVVVVWTHVTVSVARIHIDLTVAVDVSRRKAVHGVPIWEHVGHVRERLVAVVLEIGVRPTAVDQIDVPVVVKVFEFGLQKEARHLKPAARRDVCEIPRAVVFKEQQRCAVVGHETIEIAVVVDVRKICRPALLKKHQTPCGCLFRVIPISIIDPKLIHPARVLRVIHKLATLGDVQVEIAVAVKVRPHRTVVAAVVRVGITSRVVARQGHEVLVVVQRSAFRALPQPAYCVVMTCEHVQHAILVHVGHVAGLHEHRAVVQTGKRSLSWCSDVHQMHPVVGAAAEDVFVPIVVEISHTHPPLAGP